MYNDWSNGKERDVETVYCDANYRIYRSPHFKEVEIGSCWYTRSGEKVVEQLAIDEGVQDFYYIQNLKKDGNITWIYFNYGDVNKSKKATKLFRSINGWGDVNDYSYYNFKKRVKDNYYTWEYKYSELRKNVFSKIPQKLLFALPGVIAMLVDEEQVGHQDETILNEHVKNDCMINGDTFLWKKGEDYNTLALVWEKLKKIQIGNDVEEIEEGFFENLQNLEEVTFEKDSICTKIGKKAFENTGIRKIVIPKSVKVLEEGSFAKNSHLKEVIFEEGSQLEIIKQNAFMADPELRDFVIPKSVKEIGKDIFSCYGPGYKGCQRLEEGSQLEIWGGCGLYGDHITIPKSVRVLEDRAISLAREVEFESMKNLERVSNSMCYGCPQVLILPEDADNIAAILNVVHLRIETKQNQVITPEIRIHGKYRPKIFNYAMVEPDIRVYWIDENIMEKCGDYKIWSNK